MGIDPLAIAGEQRQLLLHRLLLVETGLARVEQRRLDHHVRHFKAAQDKRVDAVAVQRRADQACRLCMPIEQDVLQGISTSSKITSVSISSKRLASG
jgi:hypothetical protein